MRVTSFLPRDNDEKREKKRKHMEGKEQKKNRPRVLRRACFKSEEREQGTKKKKHGHRERPARRSGFRACFCVLSSFFFFTFFSFQTLGPASNPSPHPRIQPSAPKPSAAKKLQSNHRSHPAPAAITTSSIIPSDASLAGRDPDDAACYARPGVARHQRLLVPSLLCVARACVCGVWCVCRSVG